MSTDTRVAIVTGGSRGIGRQVAERLAADGLAVVVNYAGNEKEALAAVDTITGRGGRAIAVRADVADPAAVALFLDGKDEETIDRMAKQPPLERLGNPEDIAEVVAFLAGPARWVNGQVLRANGGIV